MCNRSACALFICSEDQDLQEQTISSLQNTINLTQSPRQWFSNCIKRLCSLIHHQRGSLREEHSVPFQGYLNHPSGHGSARARRFQDLWFHGVYTTDVTIHKEKKNPTGSRAFLLLIYYLFADLGTKVLDENPLGRAQRALRGRFCRKIHCRWHS